MCVLTEWAYGISSVRRAYRRITVRKCNCSWNRLFRARTTRGRTGVSNSKAGKVSKETYTSPWSLPSQLVTECTCPCHGLAKNTLTISQRIPDFAVSFCDQLINLSPPKPDGWVSSMHTYMQPIALKFCRLIQ